MEPPEITFIVSYRCPRCHAALEARTSEWQSWLRCPSCGRASLPPEHMRVPRRPTLAPGDDVLVIGPLSDAAAISAAGSFESATHPGGARRIALAVGLLVSVAMLLIAFLDGNSVNAAIFGLLTIVLFAVLISTSRRR